MELAARNGPLPGMEGKMHRVTITADGFSWEGKSYKSLSQIACAITGTRWNGPRLFGFRNKSAREAFAVKNGIRYRYYISTPLLHGKSELAGTVARVPAPDVEDTIIKALRERLEISEPEDNRTLLQTYVERVEIQTNRLAVTLKADAAQASATAKKGNGKLAATIIHIPWTQPPTKRGRDIVLPTGVARDETRPVKAARRAKLIASIAKGRRWLDELVSGQIKNPEEIAKRERCSVRKVNMTISLAFLAPTLVKTVVEGTLPRGITA